MPQGLGLGLPGEFHGVFVGAVDDEDLRALLHQAEDGGPRRAARAQHRNPRPGQPQPLLQRPDDSSHVGVEAVQFAVGPGAQRVAGADAKSERVHVGQMGQHLLFEGHGHGHACQRQSAHQGQQVVQHADLERQHHCVHVLAAEGGVLHERRERVGDGVAGHAEDARRLV